MIAQIDDGEGGRFKRHWTTDGKRTLCDRDIENEDFPKLRLWHVTDEGETEQQFYADLSGENCQVCRRGIGYKLHPTAVELKPVKNDPLE